MSRLSSLTERAPGSRLVTHALIALLIFGVLTWFNQVVDPLMSYYLATAAMYATAMFGMTILVGLSGQVSLGNGALMAVGGYVFALTSLNWQTVPILGTPWNAVWSMVFAGIGGVVFGLLIGGVAARLRGPYLAGLTLGVAVGVPAIANRFPGLLGGENGLMLQVPYPAGGYGAGIGGVNDGDIGLEEGLDAPDELGEEPLYEEIPDDLFDEAPLDEGVAEEDVLTDDDFLSEDDFLSDEDFLTEDDFATDEGFESDAGGDPDADPDAVAEEDMLTEDDFLSEDDFLTEDDFATDEGFESDIEPGVEEEFVEDPGAAGDIDLAGVDSGFVIEQWQASVAVAVACIVGFVALNLVRGRQGRVWQAVRDDPVAAAVSGISPAGSKVSAFVVSSLFAALAGAVFAQILSYVGPGAFTLGLSLSLLVGIVLGGRNSLVGAMIGAVILVWLPEFVLSLASDRGWEEQVTNNAPNFIYGLAVVLVVLAAPGGLVGGVSDLVRRATRR